MNKKISLLIFLILSASFLYSQKIKILTNHLGYDPKGPKLAVIQSYAGDSVYNCAVKQYDDDKHISRLDIFNAGPVDKWKNWFFLTVDFTALNLEGEYYIECGTNKGMIRSFPFKIQKDILERHTISDVLVYFRWQRSTGQFEKADSRITFKEALTDTLDCKGGWQDASGDYGKHLSHLSPSTYFNPQQISITAYSLNKSFYLLNKRNDLNFNQIKRRLVDEILYGADYFVRIKIPGGSFYKSIAAPGPGKKPEDRVISPEWFKLENIEGVPGAGSGEGVFYGTSFRTGAGIAIASLAMASRLKESGDYSSEVYLKTAEDAFDFLEKNNLKILNDGKENIVDDYCALAAATELFKATGKDIYKVAADKRADSLIRRLASWGTYENYWRADDNGRPFFHASDAGMPATALIYYLDICNEEQNKYVLNTIKNSLGFELAVTGEVPNAFGYARQLVQHKDGKRNSAFFFPHDTETEPWWQGENARLSSLAAAARLAIPLFGGDKKFIAELEKYAQNQIDWILGLNPFDTCMLYGTGRNNSEYMFLGSYQYTNIPGGICNGITSGINDEHDIDFNIPYSISGRDDDWRWVEQWLPHSAWYLIAVSAGNFN